MSACRFRSCAATAVFLFLGHFLNSPAQEYPFAPGVLDRIVVVVETAGSSFAGTKTTNVLAPNATFEIIDSTFPNGQTFKVGDPLLNGSVKFSFPAVTPARDLSGVFQPPMPASITFDGAWSRTAAFSYGAARVTMASIQPTACPIVGPSQINTGPPIPIGTYPVSLTRSCDLKGLTSLPGNNSVEIEQMASEVLNVIAGDGGANGGAIFLGTSANMEIRVIYKSRKRPEISIPRDTLVFAQTDGQPLPPAQSVTITNTGGLPLIWTAKATNTTSAGGEATWVKITPSSGTLESLEQQPLQILVDPAGLTGGTYSALVTIAGNTWNGPKTLVVSFNFTGTPRLSVTPASFEFFNLVLFPQQDFFVKNEGTAPMTPEMEVSSDSNWLEAPRFLGTLNPGETRNTFVRARANPPPTFAPLAPGDYNGQIVIKPASGQPATSDFPPVRVNALFHILPPKDELAILPASVVPSPDEPLQVNVDYTNFRADVTYQLGTRNDADLALRLFDDQGVLQASSDFVRVTRAEGRVTSKRLTLPKFKILPNPQGQPPEKLLLRAVFIDRLRNEVILASSDLEYTFKAKANLVGLEVVQVVQDWSNSVPLIEGKMTFVRAHLQANGGSGFTLEKDVGLRGFVGANPLSAEPLTPLTPYALVEPPDKAERGKGAYTMNFRLPENWTHGQVRLVFEAPGIACKESAGTPNDCSVTVTFQPAAPLLVKFVNIEWTDENNVTHGTVDDSDIDEEAAKLLHSLPIAAFRKNADYTTGFLRLSGASAVDLDNVLKELAVYRSGDRDSPTFNPARLYYGLVKDLPALTAGGTVGLAYRPGDVAAGGVVVGLESDTTVVHEIAHNLGRPHAVDASLPLVEKDGGKRKQGRCNEDSDAAAPDFPYFETVDGQVRPTLGPMNAGVDALVYGVNGGAMARDPLSASAIIDPFKRFELMGYCLVPDEFHATPQTWPSRFTYTELIQEVFARSRSSSVRLAANPKRDFVLVSGSIDLQQQTAAFRPLGRLSTAVPPPDPPLGPYTLQMRNAAGAVLADVAFEPSVPEREPGFAAQPGSFLIALPANAGYQQAVILRQGAVIGSLNASANPPTVEVLSPNGGENLAAENLTLRWRGSDPDGDALSYLVQFSPDGGTSWEILALNWTQESYDISQRYLKGTANGLIRVTASDGFNTASDVSNAAFSVPNRAPEVRILTPAANRLFTASQQVVFEAAASDREDGAVEGTKLEWRSSLDGLLGGGSVIQRPATSLREGSHTITATATDAAGLTATSMVKIAVMRIAPTNLADLAITRLAVPASVSLGDNLSFVVTIANQGPNDAIDVKVTNTLPAGVSFLGASLTQGTFAQSGQTVIGILTHLAAGTEATLTVNGRAAVTGNGLFTSSVSGAVVDPEPGNNVAMSSLALLPPRLVVSVTGTQLILSWPAGATGFVLQSAPGLAQPINWSTVTTPVNPSEERNTVTQALPSAPQFYRLVKP